MATAVSIANQALGWLGAKPIISFNDDTIEASLIKANYDDIRDAVLEAHNWTFALQWLEIPKLANPPLGEYKNAFPLPPDVLTVVFVGQDRNSPNNAWTREGPYIRTDADKCKLLAVMRITDPNRYSAEFIQVLAARLAADLSIALTESRSLMETHQAMYERKLRHAVARDNQQGKQRRIRSTWLQASRSRGPSLAGPTV